MATTAATTKTTSETAREAASGVVVPADVAALTQAVEAAWATRLPVPSADSFGVQYYSDWADYPDWQDRFDWDNDDAPIRFATAEDATAWLDAEEALRFERAHANWLVDKARGDAKRDLYDRRRQCLIHNGLWVQDGEDISPLLFSAVVGREPRKGWHDRARVVPDAEMKEPIDDTSAGQANQR